MKPKDHDNTPEPKPRRGRRRATAPGTGPASADGPEPRVDELKPATEKRAKLKLSERDRWLLDEKPPHY